MGECGCMYGNEVGRLKAPSGWYVFSVHRPCKSCGGAGIGFGINRMSAADLRDMDLDHLPVLRMQYGMGGIGVLEPEDLFKNMQPYFSEYVSKHDPEDDLSDDMSWDVLVDEMWEVVGESMKVQVSVEPGEG